MEILIPRFAEELELVPVNRAINTIFLSSGCCTEAPESRFCGDAEMESNQDFETIMVPQQVIKTIQLPKQVTNTVMQPRQVTNTVMEPRQVTNTVMETVREMITHHVHMEDDEVKRGIRTCSCGPSS